MNVIQIVIDSLRRDHIGAYGNPWIRTPNLDRLAGQSVVFEGAALGSFPTLPHRTDLFTGRYAFRKYAWQGLPADEASLAGILAAAGVKTQLVMDNPHLMAQGRGFDRGFTGSEWIRGQEDDPYRNFPREIPEPRPLRKWRNPKAGYKQYMRNVHGRRTEADYSPARVASAAIKWLEQNARDGDFFLHVEFFDPHEPWDPPKGYAERYGMDKRAAKIIYPAYGLSDPFTVGEQKNIRALYAGEVTLVDKYVGKVLDAIERLGLARSSAVLLTADHGVFLGDQGLMGKALVELPWSPEKRRYVNGATESIPFYRTLSGVPLFVRMPGVAPRRTSALVQPVDQMATVLELCGILRTSEKKAAGAPPEGELTARGTRAARLTGFEPKTLHGRSFAQVLRGATDAHRPISVSSYTLKYHDPLRARTAITDGEFILHYNGRYGDGKQKTAWTAALRRKAGFRGGIEPFLVHPATDPAEGENLLAPNAKRPPGVSEASARDRAVSLHAAYVKFLEDIGTPEEHLESRRWFPIRCRP